MSAAMSGWLIFCNLRGFSGIIFPSCDGSSISDDFFLLLFLNKLFIDPCLPERQVLREGSKKGDVSSQVNNIGW